MFTIYADGELIYQPNDQELLILQPKLTLEMGASGSLDFRIPPTHPFYNKLKQLTTVITASLDGVEIFRGRVLSNSRDFYNYRQTYCEGCLSYLVDSVQKGEKYVGTAHSLFRQIIAKHNSLVNAEKQFTVGNITVDDKDLKIAGKSTGDEEDPDSYSADYWRQIYIDSVVDNWSTTWDYINRTLIDYQGGYLMVRRVGNTNYLDWVKEFSSTAEQPIEFGSNLLDLTEEISADQLFTVLIPIGDDNLTIASVNGGSIELVDTEKVAQYGRIVRTEVFSNVNSAATLLENGRNYLRNEANVPVTFTIKAVDLSMINRDISAIRLGDRVKISSTPHSIDKYYTCTRIEYDLENPSNTVFTFGNPHQTLTQRYRKDKRIEKESAERNSVTGSSVQQETADDVMHFHIAGELDDLEDKITNSSTGDTKKKLDEFWDAWIHTNASQGNINLGAVYKRLEDAVLVLQQNAGLDIDAPSGTVNIFTTATTADSAQTTANSADSKAGDAQTKTAQIILWAGVDENGNLGSNIALNADLVSVSNRLTALEGVFDSITANKIHANRLIDSAGGFYGSSFIVSDITGGPNEVDLAGHKHSLYCDSNGNVTMGLPVSPDLATGFNIAETQFFQDAVSAAGAASVKSIVANRETTDGNIVWNAENMTLGADFTLVAKDKDGNTLYSEFEYPITLPATKAFNAGKASAAITASDITIAKAASPDPYGTDQDENKYINVTATITNPDGTTTTKTTSILVGDIYDAGEQSVTVSSLVQYSFMDIGPNLTVTSPNTDWTGSYLRVSPQIVLSNGKSQVVRLYIDATKARATVNVDGISSLSASATTSNQHTINSAGTSYNATTGKLEVKVRTRLTNSAKYDSTLLIDPSTAQAAVNISSASGTTYNSSADHSCNIIDANARYSNGMLYGTIEATLSNGTTETVYIGIDASKAVAAGSETSGNASISTVTGTTYNSNADHSCNILSTNTQYISGMLYGTIEATLSNGTTETIYIGIDPLKAQNAVTISSVTAPETYSYEYGDQSVIVPSADTYFNSSVNKLYAKVNILLSNGSTAAYILTIDPSKVPNTTSGVTISTVSGRSYLASSDHSANISNTNVYYYNGYLYGTFDIGLSNGVSETLTVGVSAAPAIDATGANSVYISNTSGTTYSSSADHSANITNENAYYYYGMLYGRVLVQLSNGKTETVYIGIDATKAVEAGSSGGSSAVYVSRTVGTNYASMSSHSANITKSQSFYTSGMLYGTVEIQLSNNTTESLTIGIDASKALASVGDPSSIHITQTAGTSYSSSADHSCNVDSTRTLYMSGMLYGRILATLSNGNQETVYIGMDASKAYNAGYNRGKSDGSGSSGVEVISCYSLAGYGGSRSDGEGGRVCWTTVQVNLSNGTSSTHYIQFAG